MSETDTSPGAPGADDRELHRGRARRTGRGTATGVRPDRRPTAGGDETIRFEQDPVATPRLTRRGRVRKWDRPPPPHDWRWYVGNVGKVLIAVGLLMFGFVGYQLYGTGIETAAAQNALEDDFEELLAQSAPIEAPDVREQRDTDPPTAQPADTLDDEPRPAEVDTEPVSARRPNRLLRPRPWSPSRTRTSRASRTARRSPGSRSRASVSTTSWSPASRRAT